MAKSSSLKGVTVEEDPEAESAVLVATDGTHANMVGAIGVTQVNVSVAEVTTGAESVVEKDVRGTRKRRRKSIRTSSGQLNKSAREALISFGTASSG